MQTSDFITSAKRTINLELNAVNNLIDKLDHSFVTACNLILKCSGRVVVVGIGKSGHIGRKIAATLASTGTAAFFVHPAEASHGDMGMITSCDLVLALSNSGSTTEIITLLPLIKRLGIKLVSITGNPNSLLAKLADANLNAQIEQEACPLNLAPTSSTTVSLVLGDALAIALLEARGFTAEDFAFSHPGGALGRKLLLKVEDIMQSEQNLPKVKVGSSVSEALLEITSKGLGITAIVDANNHLVGIFTDGDLRRAIDEGLDVRNLKIDALMTKGGITVKPQILAGQALKIMQDRKINSLIVLDDQGFVIGALNMHNLLQAGVI